MAHGFGTGEVAFEERKIKCKVRNITYLIKVILYKRTLDKVDNSDFLLPAQGLPIVFRHQQGTSKNQ